MTRRPLMHLNYQLNVASLIENDTVLRNRMEFIDDDLTISERKRYCKERKIFIELIHECEANMKKLSWRMNPYTDPTFKKWNDKLVKLCHRWNVNFCTMKLFLSSHEHRYLVDAKEHLVST